MHPFTNSPSAYPDHRSVNSAPGIVGSGIDPSLGDGGISGGAAYLDDSCIFGMDRGDAGSSSAGSSHEVIIARNQEQTKTVFRYKLVVVLVLITSATIMAAFTYLYLSHTERSHFRHSFQVDSDKIIQAVGSNLDKTLGILDSVAIAFVSLAHHSQASSSSSSDATSSASRNNNNASSAKNTNVNTNTTAVWPYVYMPDFAMRMSKLLPLTAAVNINILPLVSSAQRREWESYATAHSGWINDGMLIQQYWEGYHGPIVYNGTRNNSVIHGDFGDLPYNISRNFLPVWQNFPVIANMSWTMNYDWLSISFPESYRACLEQHQAIFSKPYMIPSPGDVLAQAETELWAEIFRDFIPATESSMEPVSDLSYPIVDELRYTTASNVGGLGSDGYVPSEHRVVGIIGSSVYWRSFIRGILPEGSNGIQIVFDNACTESFTYQFHGNRVEYLGVRDLHDRHYDSLGRHYALHQLLDMNGSLYSGARLNDDLCPMAISIYPSDVMKDAYTSATPILCTLAVIFIFAFASLVFYMYDSKVERRQQTVMQTAVRSSAIVSSLFPSAVRDRLYPQEEDVLSKKKVDSRKSPGTPRLHQSLLAQSAASPMETVDEEQGDSNTTTTTAAAFTGSPIAELYPDTTVLFADISGFTAWSATRQPTQVFMLLETLYAAFDKLAKQHRIFKVETIGDCYLAVVGLPTPRKRHAVAMARFASACCSKMREVTTELEPSLGVGTAKLALRVGLNSGPTTAGVLRGEKSRFQLFGDTVNTASRMESSGEPNKIHVSQETADLITLAGKGHWLTARTEQVNCKGKGLMTTYFCEPDYELGASISDIRSSSASCKESLTEVNDSWDARHQRLLELNLDVFAGLLKDVLAQQYDVEAAKEAGSLNVLPSGTVHSSKPMDEVAEVLSFPTPTVQPAFPRNIPEIDASLFAQLRDLMDALGKMFKPNAYHNFEHASHVAQSTKMMLDVVLTASNEMRPGSEANLCILLADPITRLAILFASLAHACNHPGVSNDDLARDNHHLALAYDERCIVEQSSIDAFWRLLLEPRFDELRACMFHSDAKRRRFRQVFVNAVMATNRQDDELNAIRSLRAESAAMGTDHEHALRSTILVDLIMQASVVSHMMQHFAVYQKWSTCLLEERLAAFKSGRSLSNPLDDFYESELKVFDDYVIPLGQKLQEDGIFGSLCDEFLDHVMDNRMEWETKGRDIVQATCA